MAANEAERARWNDERRTRTWPRREHLTDAVTPYLLDAVALRPGERVLEVGSGGGRTALAAGRLVGEGGLVVGADVSEPLTGLAAGRAAEAGAGNVRFRIVDMQTGRVDEAPFDVAMSQFGVMFFDEPVTAFRNIRGHLRPGGRLGFACWRSLRENPWFPGKAVERFVPAPPEPAPGKSVPGPFAFADPERTAAILREAGFVGIERMAHSLELDGPQEWVVDDDQLLLMLVPEERLDAAREAVDEYLDPLRRDSGLFRFPLAFQIFTAGNPA